MPLALASAFGLGLAAGWMGGSRSAATKPTGDPKAMKSTNAWGETAASSPDCSGTSMGCGPNELRTAEEDDGCAQQLRLAQALLDGIAERRVGTYTPIPGEYEDLLEPEAVEAEVKRAVAECLDSPAPVLAIDCAEYPCLAAIDVDLAAGADRLLSCHESDVYGIGFRNMSTGVVLGERFEWLLVEVYASGRAYLGVDDDEIEGEARRREWRGDVLFDEMTRDILGVDR